MAPTAVTPTTTARRSYREVALRWWLAAATLLGCIALQLAGTPLSAPDRLVWMLPTLPLIYLAFGTARGALRRPGVLPVQLAGLVGWTALTVVALLVERPAARYVVAAGWFAHGIWDVAHHRDLNRNRCTGVVPRWYAEACVIVDILVGASLLVPIATIAPAG